MHYTHRACVAWYIFQEVSTQLLITSVEVILMIRVHALYDRNCYIAAILLVLFLAETITMITTLILVVPKVEYDSICIVTHTPSNLFVFALAFILFETILFILTLVQFVRALRTGWGHTPVVTLLARDGTWAFAVIFGALILNDPRQTDQTYSTDIQFTSNMFSSSSSSGEADVYIGERDRRRGVWRYHHQSRQTVGEAYEMESAGGSRRWGRWQKDGFDGETVVGSASGSGSGSGIATRSSAALERGLESRAGDEFILIAPAPRQPRNPKYPPRSSLCDAWTRAIQEILDDESRSHFLVLEGALHTLDAAQLQCDCMVSPANSFGIMDGGYDLDLSKSFKGEDGDIWTLTRHIQSALRARWWGYAPPSSCTIVPLPSHLSGAPNNPWSARHIAVIPTMRTPEDVSWHKDLVYNSMWSLLVEIARWNEAASRGGQERIERVLMTGLATGQGGVLPRDTAWTDVLPRMDELEKTTEL
ncbi:hypothetical protein EW146_g8063 [Bondarzewia mesenterica]|uniref:Macro-like domain-containing protein n=1 Tax=Bondarzewia mesenterica TaxID=1095465 RepID=A0A4S4LI19_9AGAM|nr:hypothetical protein EW146_g8063 [Bondarzewia mesenterica]